MVRKFFAWLVRFVFAIVAFPAVFFGVLLLTWFNPEFIKSTIIPESYSLAVNFFGERLAAEDIAAPADMTMEEWLASIFPRDLYVDLMRQAIDEFTAALQNFSGGVQEVSLKNTKTKLLSIIESALYKLPACDTSPPLSAADDIPRGCIPAYISGADKKIFVARILEEFDASLPTRIVLNGERFGDQAEAIRFIARNDGSFSYALFAIPFVFLCILALVVWSPVHRVLRAVGGALLVLSFEAFAMLFLFMNTSELAKKAFQTAGEAAKGAESAVEVVAFLFKFLQPYFLYITVGSGILGFFMLLAGYVLKHRATEAASESAHAAASQHTAPITVRNGSLKKGSQSKS